jgi:hypothetical protein
MDKLNKKHETSRMLRVVYTDKARLELGKKLADEYAELRQVNSDFDRIKAEYKSKITSREATIEDLSNKVSTGFELVAVKCRWEMDQPEQGKKELIRLDTFEVIETGPMTTADLQSDMELPLAVPAGTNLEDEDIDGDGDEADDKDPEDADPLKEPAKA